MRATKTCNFCKQFQRNGMCKKQNVYGTCNRTLDTKHMNSKCVEWEANYIVTNLPRHQSRIVESQAI